MKVFHQKSSLYFQVFLIWAVGIYIFNIQYVTSNAEWGFDYTTETFEKDAVNLKRLAKYIQLFEYLN